MARACHMHADYMHMPCRCKLLSVSAELRHLVLHKSIRVHMLISWLARCIIAASQRSGCLCAAVIYSHPAGGASAQVHVFCYW